MHFSSHLSVSHVSSLPLESFYLTVMFLTRISSNSAFQFPPDLIESGMRMRVHLRDHEQILRLILLVMRVFQGVVVVRHRSRMPLIGLFYVRFLEAKMGEEGTITKEGRWLVHYMFRMSMYTLKMDDLRQEEGRIVLFVSIPATKPTGS